MKEKTILILCAMLCTTVIICGVLFWPTLYRYDKTERRLVRNNRLTGYTEILLKECGWKPVDLLILPDSERAKIIAPEGLFEEFLVDSSIISKIPAGSFLSLPCERTLRITLYNGSEWTVNKMFVVIEAKHRKEDTARWKRKYKANIKGSSIDAFSTGTIIIEPIDVYANDVYIWSIDRVYGYRFE